MPGSFERYQEPDGRFSDARRVPSPYIPVNAALCRGLSRHKAHATSLPEGDPGQKDGGTIMKPATTAGDGTVQQADC